MSPAEVVVHFAQKAKLRVAVRSNPSTSPRDTYWELAATNRADFKLIIEDSRIHRNGSSIPRTRDYTITSLDTRNSPS
jgi:hypothetical protein